MNKVVKIANQTITLLADKTIIVIDYAGRFPSHTHKYKFNLMNDFEIVEKEIRPNNYAEYMWLGRLYNEIHFRTNPVQLTLKFE